MDNIVNWGKLHMSSQQTWIYLTHSVYTKSVYFRKRKVAYNWLSGSHACRDCVWPIILDAELYTTCPGERVLVAIRFNVTFLPLKLCYENTRDLFLERCRNSNNVWSRALMSSDCLYSSLYFEHYNRILLCEWVIELCSIRLIDSMSCHNAFAFYLD